MNIETREVLADAYLRPRPEHPNGHRMLTHAVFVDRDCRAAEVLCRRVRLDSIADRNSGNDLTAAPTCKHCQRELKKRFNVSPGTPTKEE